MRLAVYGTLKDRVYGKYLGDDWIDSFALYVNGLPYAVPSKGDKLYVKVYEIDPITLKSIDRIEGYIDEERYWYRRIKVPTQYGEAFMYIQETIPAGTEKKEDGIY